MRTYFKPGQWNAICDVCGFRFKSDELMKRWDGLMTCHKDYEQDHPQKYLRVDAEKSQDVEYVRFEPTDTFISVSYRDPPICTAGGSTAIVGMAIAGCAVVLRYLEG